MYKTRIADKVLKKRLDSKGAVLIEGPKWCGKTETAKQAANSMLNLADYATLSEARGLVELNPSILIRGETPKLIDEWQEIPRLWDIIRGAVDQRQAMGQFILTGSAVPVDRSEIIHTGTGRITRMTMRTMSLWESGESGGEISLKDLFSGEKEMVGTNNLDLDHIAYLICRGGWPIATMLEGEPALQQAIDYYDAVINFDITRVDGVRRSAMTANRIMRSYARHIGLQSPITTIRDDISNGEQRIDPDTVSAYLTSLKQIFVIEEMKAWNPNLRSKTAIRTTETRYYTDPSIACAAMGIGPGNLIKDLKCMGMMFENLCVRDLRAYTEPLGGEVMHYRDANGLECDSVITLRNGQYGLVEIKLGGDRLIEDGAATLTKLASKIDTDAMPAPAFLMILTATGNYAYRRKDGIWIVPIGTLRP